MIIAKEASKGAIEKMEKAGGKIEVKAKKEEKVVEAVEKKTDDVKVGKKVVEKKEKPKTKDKKEKKK